MPRIKGRTGLDDRYDDETSGRIGRKRRYQ